MVPALPPVPMPELFSPAPLTWQDLGLRLGLATLLGLLLGLDREIKGKSAGLRTHGLVALSSAALTALAVAMAGVMDHPRQPGDPDPLRVIQGVAQAVGLICAGMIIQGRGAKIRNLTTAATVWTAAALGMAAGAGMYGIAVATAILTHGVLLLGHLVRALFPQEGGED